MRSKFLIAILLVIIITTTVTLYAAYFTKQVVNQKLESFFIQQADQIAYSYSSDLTSHITVLNGFQGLWNATDPFDHKTFVDYSNKLYKETTFEEGISGFFYIRPVPWAEKDKYENQIRREKNISLSYKNFKIYPDSNKDILYPVTYIEPVEGREKSIGLDFGTYPERLIVIENARDTGTLSTSQITTFASTNKPGFFFLLPLYRQDLPNGTITERREAFEGVVGISFRSESAFTFDKIEDSYPFLDFQIYLGNEVNPDNLLYDHDEDFTAVNPRFKTTRVIHQQKQTWTILVQSKPSLSLTDPEMILPNLVLFSGLIGTALLVTFFLTQYYRYLKTEISTKSSQYSKT